MLHPRQWRIPPAITSTWAMAALALVLAMVAYTAGSDSPCANAQASCPFDDDSIINGDWVLRSNTAFDVIVDHSATADATLTLPDTAGVADTFVMTALAQTLTNKTLTAPAITSPVITGAPTCDGCTWADLGSVTTADINAGTIDGVAIGGGAPAAGTFTTLTGATLGGALDINNENITNIDVDSGAIDGTTIGASAAAAGTFTNFIIPAPADTFLKGDTVLETGTIDPSGGPSNQTHGLTAIDSAFGIYGWAADANIPARLVFAKSRSGVIGDDGVALDNDIAGEIRWEHTDTSGWNRLAMIQVEVDDSAPGGGNRTGARMNIGVTDGTSSVPLDTIVLNADQTINLNGNTDLGNNNLSNIGNAGTDITSTGATFASGIPVTVNDTTGSTTKDTGAVIVEGGVGIEENLIVGGNSVTDGQEILGAPALDFGVIRAFIHLSGLADGVATEVFTVSTTDEAVFDAGAWHISMIGFAGHRITSGATGGAMMGWSGRGSRHMAHTVGEGLVAETYQDAVRCNDCGARSISDITVTSVETTEFITSILFKIDLLGSAISTGEMTLEVTLIYDEFETPPVITNS